MTYQTQLTKTEYEIVLGRDDYSITVIKMSFDRDCISFTHDSYDSYLMTETEGQDRANDYLDEDFLRQEWKYSVENDYTDKSLEDYKQEYIDQHDWTEIIGDIKDICVNGNYYYTQLSSCGCLSEHYFRDIEKSELNAYEIETIKNADELLHLKSMNQISGHKPLEKLLKEVTEIFQKHEPEDLDMEIAFHAKNYNEIIGENENE